MLINIAAFKTLITHLVDTSVECFLGMNLRVPAVMYNRGEMCPCNKMKCICIHGCFRAVQEAGVCFNSFIHSLLLSTELFWRLQGV